MELLEISEASEMLQIEKSIFPNHPIMEYGGYYQLEQLPRGAFLSIDIKQSYPSKKTETNISWSFDGKNSDSASNVEIKSQGNSLAIEIEGAKGVIGLLVLYKDRNPTQVHARLSGQINDQWFKGYTYFKTAPLEVFVGEYFSPVEKKKYLQIEENGKISFNPVPEGITGYTYNPSMFVVSFDQNGRLPSMNPENNFELMLGTASYFGLACSYSKVSMTGSPATLLLSILPQ